jgi:hypothetical protein
MRGTVAIRRGPPSERMQLVGRFRSKERRIVFGRTNVAAANAPPLDAEPASVPGQRVAHIGVFAFEVVVPYEILSGMYGEMSGHG